MDLNIISEQVTETQPYGPQAQIFKVLSHPARLAILEMLRNGEHCVCHMEAHLGFRQAYISQQLSVLRNAGLVEDRRDGWSIFYRVIDRRVFHVIDAARIMTGQSAFESVKPYSLCASPHCSTKMDNIK